MLKEMYHRGYPQNSSPSLQCRPAGAWIAIPVRGIKFRDDRAVTGLEYYVPRYLEDSLHADTQYPIESSAQSSDLGHTPCSHQTLH
jgi:hypothetical protein